MRRSVINNRVGFGFGRTSFVTGQNAIAQRVKAALLLFKGEWYRDPTVGMPWISRVGAVTNTDGILTQPLSEITRQILDLNIRRIVEQLEGVTTLRSLDFLLDRETRALLITLRIETEDGDLDVPITLEVA